MIKPNLRFNATFSGPVGNRSGYGLYSDFIARCLISYPHFNTTIIPIGFGTNIPRQISTPFDKEVQRHIAKGKLFTPHIHVSCQLPHLEQPKGGILNLNYNAGFETSFTYPNIIQGLNRWDYINVMSKFSKQVYLDSTPAPTKPIDVINPGIDTDTFNAEAPSNSRVDAELAKLKETEAYLFVGQLTHGQPFLDRKNAGTLIKLFCEVFKGQANKPALILKTGGTNYGAVDRYNILNLIKTIKNTVPHNDVTIALLHGELSDAEMASLYTHKKIVGHVTLTRGEGYGLPLLEASMSGTPILAPNHSGHLDFLGDRFIQIAGELKEIHPQAVSEYYPKGSKWFEVNEDQFKQTLQQYHRDRDQHVNSATKLAEINRTKFGLPNTIKNMHSYYDRILSTVY